MTATTDEPGARQESARSAEGARAATALAEQTVASQRSRGLRSDGDLGEEGAPAAGSGAAGGSWPDRRARGAGAARRGRPSLRRCLLVGVAVAALAAAVLGALWVLALTSGSLALARDRDAVLVDARQAATNLNTLDYRNVDAGLDLWQQSSTGPVLAEFQQNRAQYAALVRESRRTTVATVPEAAVTELDEHAGVARVLAAVDVTVTPDGQPPAVTRQRLQMEMTRTPQGWKVSKLSPVRSPTTSAGN